MPSLGNIFKTKHDSKNVLLDSSIESIDKNDIIEALEEESSPEVESSEDPRNGKQVSKYHKKRRR